VAATSLQIERLDGSLLRIDGLSLAERFFASDRSSIGANSYDELAGQTAPNRIEAVDIKALNRTMRARSKHGRWAELADTELPWLKALRADIDLIASDEQTWSTSDTEKLIASALAATVGTGRGPSVATKMLHLKRPRLFPILDNLVAQALGAKPVTRKPHAEQAAQATRLLIHLRQQGQNNLEPLTEIQDALKEQRLERSLVRILDVAIWASHPAAAGGRRVFAISADQQFEA
jgi:hypothetical protein